MNQIIKCDTEFLKTESEVHILPCKIYFNRETDVKSFFSSSITKTAPLKQDDDHDNQIERM